MKKQLLTIICAILCAVICLSLAACSTPADNGTESTSQIESSTEESTPAPVPEETPAESKQPSSHYHDFADEWSKDENSHWHACDYCVIKRDEAPHDLELIATNEEPGENTAGRGIFACTVCGGVYDLPIPPLSEENN